MEHGPKYYDPLHCLLYGTSNEWKVVSAKARATKVNNSLNLHSELIGGANGYGLAFSNINKNVNGTINIEYSMESGSWNGSWAFTLNNVETATSIPKNIDEDYYGDGTLLFKRISVINSTLATNTTGRYQYNMNISNKSQPIFMICAPDTGQGNFTGVYIYNYYIDI